MIVTDCSILPGWSRHPIVIAILLLRYLPVGQMPLREVEFPSDPEDLADAKEEFLIFYSSRTNGQLWCPVSASLTASHKPPDWFGRWLGLRSSRSDHPRHLRP
jgi:hypothetical protein